MSLNNASSQSRSMAELPFSQQMVMVHKNLSPLLRLLWETAKGLVILQLLLYLIQSLTPGAFTYLSKISIDVLAKAVTGDRAAIQLGLVLLAVSAGLQLINLGIGLAMQMVERYMSTYFTQKIDTMVAAKAQRLPLTFFDQSQSYDQMQRARSGFGERGIAVASAVMRIGSSLVTLISYLLLVAMVGRWLPVALLPIVVLSLFLNMRWGQERYALARTQTASSREIGYLQGLLTGPEFAKELRLFGLGAYLTDRWLTRYIKVRNESLSLFWKQSLAGLSNNGLNFLISLLTMLWLFNKLAHGEVSVGTYIATTGAVSAAIGLMPAVAASISHIYEQALYTTDLFQFLSLPEEEQTGVLPFPALLHRGITVENLAYRYPGTDKVVLKNVSFTIRPGERVAIVGENGSGKTTLAKCLLGLYLPDQGTIQYDGLDLRALDPACFRSQVTAVFQDFVRYALTARENVGFGHLSHLEDDAALEVAAAKSGIAEAIHSFPQGWDTRLGRMWDGGQELSYGQWQRMAIARALLRDAQVVILDEPTAALDPKAEAALVEQFATVVQGRTSLVISHRLGTARTADHILVLKEGALIEEGTHEQLLRQGGEYARMFELQARWYV